MSVISSVAGASLRPLALVCAASLLLPAVSPAQTFDHLKCFKIRDEKTFDSAAVDLDALASEFGLQGCTVKGRAKTLCIPVDKDVTSISGGTVTPVGGDEIAQARLCYKLSCPASAVTQQDVSDQFGSRSVTGFKAVQLCTPVEAPPTTTTTNGPTTTTTLEEALDDDFEGASLDPAWTVLNPARVNVAVGGGALSLTATMSGATNVWFEDGEGPLVYKQVTGDFDVSTTITVRDPSNPSNPPPTQYRLAGILARDPASAPGSRNTVHVALGAGATAQGTATSTSPPTIRAATGSRRRRRARRRSFACAAAAPTSSCTGAPILSRCGRRSSPSTGPTFPRRCRSASWSTRSKARPASKPSSRRSTSSRNKGVRYL